MSLILEVFIKCDHPGCDQEAHAMPAHGDRASKSLAFHRVVKNTAGWTHERDGMDVLHFCPLHNPKREAQP